MVYGCGGKLIFFSSQSKKNLSKKFGFYVRSVRCTLLIEFFCFLSCELGLRNHKKRDLRFSPLVYSFVISIKDFCFFSGIEKKTTHHRRYKKQNASNTEKTKTLKNMFFHR